MNLVVSPEIQSRFPALRIAMLVARAIDNEGSSAELEALKRAASDTFYREWTYERLGALPQIDAWREAYRAFGVKPKDSRPTAEAFLRQLIKGERFPTTSKAVDSYLLVETEYFLPVGGYDLDTVSGDINLRFSPGREVFIPLGSSESEVTRPREVVYADSSRILTRKWNYRDCDACKITEQSRNIALFTEAPFPSVETSLLVESIDKMAGNIQRSCGGFVSTALLDCSGASSLDLDLALSHQ